MRPIPRVNRVTNRVTNRATRTAPTRANTKPVERQDDDDAMGMSTATSAHENPVLPGGLSDILDPLDWESNDSLYSLQKDENADASA